MGNCNYAKKCRFAHGKNELIEVVVKEQFRKRKCINFYQKGACQYGTRCQFSHNESEWSIVSSMIGI